METWRRKLERIHHQRLSLRIRVVASDWNGNNINFNYKIPNEVFKRTKWIINLVEDAFVLKHVPCIFLSSVCEYGTALHAFFQQACVCGKRMWREALSDQLCRLWSALIERAPFSAWSRRGRKRPEDRNRIIRSYVMLMTTVTSWSLPRLW